MLMEGDWEKEKKEETKGCDRAESTREGTMTAAPLPETGAQPRRNTDQFEPLL